MILRGALRCRPDTAKGTPKLRDGYSSVCPSLPSTPEHDEGSAVHFTPREYSARTDKVMLHWSVARPNARRRKPQGKGGWSWNMAGKSGRACLGGRGNAPPRGRQARPSGQCPDLTRVKSGRKKLFPMGEYAQHRTIHLQGMSCSRKS